MFADRLTRKQLTTAVCLVLAGVTLLVYAPVLRNGFVNYDDPDYIINNAHVKAGLTWNGVAWAFQSTEANNWHPLTWISHMADCQLFGLKPAGHHLTSLLLHTANTLLLFLLLLRLTGALWRSAFVAALFALHPLHVESVAWASERKDVLSAFFWMLTLLAYTRFVNESKVRSPKSKVFYALALLAFACGLMSKPMVVTLPFVLLLLDFWPLNRMRSAERGEWKVGPLLLEKIPFFALTIASCVITRLVQSDALWSTASLPLSFRLANAVMSYVRYLGKMFWPTDLALIYPYPHYWPLAGVIVAALLLALISIWAVLSAKRLPYLAVGWFWYLGTLVPVIGLVQAGIQSMADRYTYLPSIGLFIIVSWGLNDLLLTQLRRENIAAAVGGLALAGCVAVTSVQLTYWRNSLALFSHTIKVTTGNYAAQNCLGTTLEHLGQNDKAEECYAESVRIEPDFPLGQFNLGMILLEQGRAGEASNHLAIAAQLAPQNPVMQFDYGVYLSQHGNPADAAKYFRAALVAKPEFPGSEEGTGRNAGRAP